MGKGGVAIMEAANIRKFRKVMVANRGEIAIRIFRALNELGITTVGIYSKEDKYALFRMKADESYQLNPDKNPIDAYLDIDEIIKIANDDAFETSKLLTKKEGILTGISSGAALSAALQLAKRPEYKGMSIVALIQDSGDRYYSTPLFQSK